MKLKNKKTGEIIDTLCSYDITKGISLGIGHHDGNPTMAYYNSLAELNEDWEDYEEPKDFWYIGDLMIICGTEGEFTTPDLASFTKKDIEKLKAIGNYFETKEEAEKAVEKLKAWHKLMDYWGTEVLGWEIRDMPTGGNWQTVNVKFNVKTKKEPMELLDIVFGGEE